MTDRKGVLQALQRCKPALGKVQALLCDSGYVGKPFAQGMQDILGGHVSVRIVKRSELHKFKVMPQRWVVERSLTCVEKNRRLWKNCERLLNTSLQFAHLAFWGFYSKDFELVFRALSLRKTRDIHLARKKSSSTHRGRLGY
ncbi:transposase (plasmid) [Acidovorax sp. DW039]|nr:transposase [Acidovorax sp. DW039]